MRVTENHYTALSVSRDATPAELRAAFTRLAKASHPDVAGESPGAAARFQRVMEAFEVLRDARTRAAYDAALRGDDGGWRAGGAPDGRFDAAMQARARAFREARAAERAAGGSAAHAHAMRLVEFALRPRHLVLGPLAAAALWLAFDAVAGGGLSAYEKPRPRATPAAAKQPAAAAAAPGA